MGLETEVECRRCGQERAGRLWQSGIDTAVERCHGEARKLGSVTLSICPGVTMYD